MRNPDPYHLAKLPLDAQILETVRQVYLPYTIYKYTIYLYYTKLLNLETICFTAIDSTKAKAGGNRFNYLVKYTFGFAPLGSGSDPGKNCIHPNSFLVCQKLSLCLGVGLVHCLLLFPNFVDCSKLDEGTVLPNCPLIRNARKPQM